MPLAFVHTLSSAVVSVLWTHSCFSWKKYPWCKQSPWTASPRSESRVFFLASLSTASKRYHLKSIRRGKRNWRTAEVKSNPALHRQHVQCTCSERAPLHVLQKSLFLPQAGKSDNLEMRWCCHRVKGNLSEPCTEFYLATAHHAPCNTFSHLNADPIRGFQTLLPAGTGSTDGCKQWGGSTAEPRGTGELTEQGLRERAAES